MIASNGSCDLVGIDPNVVMVNGLVNGEGMEQLESKVQLGARRILGGDPPP